MVYGITISKHAENTKGYLIEKMNMKSFLVTLLLAKIAANWLC